MNLVFYQIEEMLHKKSYNKKLNKDNIIKIHKQICKSFGIQTKLKFNNQTLGYYDIDNNVICLSETATLGLLIHEIGHAYEWKHFKETFHKNRLFQIINEMNVYADMRC